MLKSVINAYLIHEVEVDAVPFDACRVVLGNPYMYVRDVIFMKKANHYHLIKDGKSFTIKVEVEIVVILVVDG